MLTPLPTTFPPIPKNKKELVGRLKVLLQNEATYPLPEAIGDKLLGGSGGPGALLEILLGSEGSNKALADAAGVEIKYHSKKSTTPLTLFHQEVEGGNPALVPFFEHVAYTDKKGRLAFRHTIKASSKVPRARIFRRGGKIVVTPVGTKEPSVFWFERTLVNAVSKKCQTLILVAGEKLKVAGEPAVRYTSAKILSEFKQEEFLNCLSNRDLWVDFDLREQEAGDFASGRYRLRNHGTKVRIPHESFPELWESIEAVKL